MSKVIVTVCLGTTCHLMGASHLQSLSNELSEIQSQHVEIQWKRCLGYCNSNPGKAPFVIIDGEVISEATLPKIAEKIETILQNKQVGK